MGAPEGLAVTGGVTSFLSARAQNQAIAGQASASRRAAAVQSEQLREQAAQSRDEASRRAQQVEGRLRAASGETGQDITSQTRQIGFDLSRGIDTINTNLFNSLAAVASGSAAQQLGFLGQQRSPLLAGATGALQGLSTGLSIEQATLSNDQKKLQLQKQKSATADSQSLGIPPSNFSFANFGR